MKSARRANISSDDLDDATGHELACWLQEAGRRDAIAKGQDPAQSNGVACQRELSGNPGMSDVVRRPLLLSVLALAGMQYFYVSLEVKILSLHSLIVFISQ